MVEFIQIANSIGAVMVDISNQTATIEFSGNERQIHSVLMALAPFKAKERARTGLIALPTESVGDSKEFLV